MHIKAVITQRGSVDDFFDEFKGILSRYIPHRRQHQTQRSAFDELRSTLRPGHVLMVVDFQERLSVKEQDEVQSQHWDNQCTTIFPAVVYLNLKGRVWAFSFQVLSDDMAQDNAWVQHVMSGLLNERIPDLLRKIGAAPMTNATLFTDNCAKQFKCLFQFNWVSDSGVKVQDEGGAPTERLVHVEHHYFGSGHGKNVSDSEGGVTKTWVRQMVKNMTWRIENSEDLYKKLRKDLS
ncbi:unnamed protein product, partial [Ectocarpus sp. 8 AP-2014]